MLAIIVAVLLVLLFFSVLGSAVDLAPGGILGVLLLLLLIWLLLGR